MADQRIDVPGVVISIGEAEGSAGRVHRVTLDLVEDDVVKLAHAGVLYRRVRVVFDPTEPPAR